MRVIKFRAWDGKQMDYDYRDGMLWNGLLVAEGDTILLQSTGVKDKNGKEIYEGDILDNSSGMNNYVVAWGRLGDGESETDCYGFIVPQGLDNEWYVKGNIYENPELVK